MVSIPKLTPSYQNSGGPPKNNSIFNEILSLSGLEMAEIDILYLSNA